MIMIIYVVLYFYRIVCVVNLLFVFFKQKSAYEMRISDWSSDGVLFRSTWSAFGAGRVLVGLDSLDTDFDTVEETGGEKTHVLTEAEMPVHDHPVDRKSVV